MVGYEMLAQCQRDLTAEQVVNCKIDKVDITFWQSKVAMQNQASNYVLYTQAVSSIHVCLRL